MLVFAILLVQKEPKVLVLFAGVIALQAQMHVALFASHLTEAVRVMLEVR